MTLQCGQCPQTFRTQNGKEWHALHIHGELSGNETSGQAADNVLEAMIENEISAQISDPDSPLNVALDERTIRLLGEVGQRIADSDQFMRAHLEHRVKEIVIAITSIHREPTWKGQAVEMAQPATSFTPGMIADAVEYGLKHGTSLSNEVREKIVDELQPKSVHPDHKGIRDFLASLEGS